MFEGLDLSLAWSQDGKGFKEGLYFLLLLSWMATTANVAPALKNESTLMGRLPE